MGCFLGIDTSCYTTSLALLDESGRLIADKRRILTVKSGAKGLAQSEMVFQHTRNLPALFEELTGEVKGRFRLAAIGVSAWPRALPDSYMPAFVVGEGYARMLASAQAVRLWRLSHQEGHILAGVWSAGGPGSEKFLAVHVSGGTTEIVLVEKKAGQAADITLLGGTDDLNAGQFIDRIGVALQLPFPAGRHLERLAAGHHDHAVDVPVAAFGSRVSFSGPASHCLRLLDKGVRRELLAAGVEICIAKTLSKMIAAAIRQTKVTEIILVGGVMSNSFIRGTVAGNLKKFSDDAAVYLPEAAYSPDNAVGAAFFAFQKGT